MPDTANAAGALGPLLVIIFVLGGGFYQIQARLRFSVKIIIFVSHILGLKYAIDFPSQRNTCITFFIFLVYPANVHFWQSKLNGANTNKAVFLQSVAFLSHSPMFFTSPLRLCLRVFFCPMTHSIPSYEFPRVSYFSFFFRTLDNTVPSLFLPNFNFNSSISRYFRLCQYSRNMRHLIFTPFPAISLLFPFYHPSKVCICSFSVSFPFPLFPNISNVFIFFLVVWASIPSRQQFFFTSPILYCITSLLYTTIK